MKLTTEQKNFDKLQEDKMNGEEELRLKNVQLEEDTIEVEKQNKILKDLQEKIDKEEAEVQALMEKTSEQKALFKKYDEMNRYLQQTYTSLAAKKEFIEDKYDYTTNVKNFKLPVFDQVINSNLSVNNTVADFMKKVSTEQDSVTEMLSKKLYGGF